MWSFLGIGAQKAGTTWLYEQLRQHPQLAFPLGKEAHFWNRAHDASQVADYLQRLAATEAPAGEITPAYGMLPLATIREIHAHAPQLRLIYIMRNPLHRAWSAALMALERAEMRIEEASDQWFIDHFHSAGSRQRGDYATCLRNWRAVFPDEQLLVLRFEEIAAAPEALLKRCFEHLGVAPQTVEELQQRGCRQRIFAGSGAPSRPSLQPVLRDLYAAPIRELAQYLNTDLSAWLEAAAPAPAPCAAQQSVTAPTGLLRPDTARKGGTAARFLTRIYQRWKQPQQPSVLFYRDFRGFTGGHLKVWHYFNHVQHSNHYQARIAFSAETVWDASNPWLALRGQALPTWEADAASVLFLAGMDWEILSAAQRDHAPQPILNLIQHVRHADPKQPLYQYLQHRALRICVSAQVTQALQATGRVNGPIFTIPNGMDSAELARPTRAWEQRPLDLLVVGIKQPALALEMEPHLAALCPRVQVLTQALLRNDFLELLGKARITLFLPHESEGFYLPALEGFALGTVVICPDCIGNRDFCHPAINCLQPPYSVQTLLEAVRQALQLTAAQRQTMLDNARHTAEQHSLAQERSAFLEILGQIEALW